MNQSYSIWANILDKVSIDSDDIIVAWSTGAIFSVRYLFEHNIKIKKLILISGFNNYIGKVPQVDAINKDFFMNDVTVAKDVAKEIVCIKSDNDPYITQQALDEFAFKLEAKVVTIKNGGHFNANAGYTTFQEVIELIEG